MGKGPDFFIDTVLRGNCLAVLHTIPDNTFHSCVTDPPYGLGTKEPTVGDTLRAASSEGASFIGVTADQHYHDAICDRLQTTKEQGTDT